MKATLTTLSPVHIGQGTIYNKGIDFIQKGSQIGFVDINKVAQLIGLEHINHLVSAIERYNPEKDSKSQPILDLFEGRGVRNIELEKFCSRIANLKSINNSSTLLREHCHTAIKGLFIPGSSLKGAIKTAIWDSVTTEEELEKIRAENYKSFKGKWSDTFIEKRLFGDNANEKTTRFLKIGDIHFSNIVTDIYEMKILNAYRNEWNFKEGQQILIETIPTDTQADFEFIIDVKLLEANVKNEKIQESKWNGMIDKRGQLYKKIWSDKKIASLNNGKVHLCNLINKFTKSLLQFDINNLKNEKLNDAGERMLDTYMDLLKKQEKFSENEFVIRVGGYSGYLFTTGQWVDKEGVQMSENDYYSLRKQIQRNREYDMSIWPKTRKITSDGEVFGFVKVTLDD